MKPITLIKRFDGLIQDFKFLKEQLCEIWCSLNSKEIIEFSKVETHEIMKVISDTVGLEECQKYWANKQFPVSSMPDSERMKYEDWSFEITRNELYEVEEEVMDFLASMTKKNLFGRVQLRLQTKKIGELIQFSSSIEYVKRTEKGWLIGDTY